jgi:hypothetical protein
MIDGAGHHDIREMDVLGYSLPQLFGGNASRLPGAEDSAKERTETLPTAATPGGRSHRSKR